MTTDVEPQAGPGRPPRCLLVLPQRLGDALAFRGLIASVASAGRQLITVAGDDASSVLDPMLLALRLEHTPDHLEAPLSLERRELGGKKLRQLACDEALVLDGSWWLARAAACGIPRRAGARGLYGPFATERFPAASEHPTDTAPRWVEALGLPWVEASTVLVSKAWRRLGKERLQNAKVDLDARTLGVYRGTAGGRSGSWSDKAFEELLRQVRRRHPKLQIVILSTHAKRDLWKSVLLYENTGKIHPVIGPDLNLDGLGAVMSYLDLFVAADSSMLQVAAAVGTPTLGLFERRALRLAPRGPAADSIQRSPLSRVSVDDVLERVEILLQPPSTTA
ncbi:MAG: glycosyltransferase family 9 protein [Acidobacteriota bacterium]